MFQLSFVKEECKPSQMTNLMKESSHLKKFGCRYIQIKDNTAMLIRKSKVTLLIILQVHYPYEFCMIQHPIQSTL